SSAQLFKEGHHGGRVFDRDSGRTIEHPGDFFRSRRPGRRAYRRRLGNTTPPRFLFLFLGGRGFARSGRLREEIVRRGKEQQSRSCAEPSHDSISVLPRPVALSRISLAPVVT